MKRNSPFASSVFAVALTLSLTYAASTRAQPIPTLDPNFHPVITRAGGFVSAVAVQADGKLVRAGSFNAINGVARYAIARVNADGTIEPAAPPWAQSGDMELAQCINRLPEIQRTVITLFYLEEKRVDEVARMLGIPEGTVKSHLHRARLALGGMMKE